MASCALLAAVVLAGCGGESQSHQRARAIADARKEIGAGRYAGGPRCCHVSYAAELDSGLWQVEVKWNEAADHRSCAKIQLDRFYIRRSSDSVSDGGYAVTPGPCHRISTGY